MSTGGKHLILRSGTRPPNSAQQVAAQPKPPIQRTMDRMHLPSPQKSRHASKFQYTPLGCKEHHLEDSQARQARDTNSEVESRRSPHQHGVELTANSPHLPHPHTQSMRSEGLCRTQGAHLEVVGIRNCLNVVLVPARQYCSVHELVQRIQISAF